MLHRIALCLGLCWSIACASDIVPATLPSGLGINIHFTRPHPGVMSMLRKASFRIARMDFDWSRTERQKGQYDFADYDHLLKTLEDNNIRSLWILDYANPLYDQNLSPCTDEGRRAFAAWATAAVRHFAGHHILWEMYNEPDGAWKPRPNTGDYIKLALEVGKAIHQAAPKETYIGPATAGIDLPFLEQCFKAGLLDDWSAVTVHPYRHTPPETVASDYRALRQLIARYAPRGKQIPIFSGEWGYSDAWAGFDQTKQGKYLARQWLTNVMNHVPVSIWYDWHDDGADPKNPEHHFGTVLADYHLGRDPVYDAKPAYRTAQTITSILGGYRFDQRLPAQSPQDYVLIFRKGDEIRLAAWTTADRPHPITLPPTLGASFRSCNDQGVAGPDLRATNAGLSLQVTDAPVYLIPGVP